MSDNKQKTEKSGYAPLRSLLKKWDVLSGNIKTYSTKAPILLPDLFINADNGCDITGVLRSLTDYLTEKKNLMDFYGDVEFFEFYLNYCRPDSEFSEIRRLMREVKTAAGFRSHYKGIVHIVINEWLSHHNEKHFAEFLNYLAENSSNWLIVLSVTNQPNKKTQIDAMEAVLTMYLRLETLRIKQPDSEFYLGLLRQNLASYGITLSADALELMRGTIRALRRNKHFGGESTVNMLALDIGYTVFSRPGDPGAELSKEALEEFSPESEYVKRTLAKLEMTNRIGFTE